MFFVYVIYSENAKVKYTGYTSDLEDRIKKHNEGFPGAFTNNKGPWTLIYVEEFENRSEAIEREKYLKTGAGRDFIKSKTGR